MISGFRAFSGVDRNRRKKAPTAAVAWPRVRP